VSETIDLDAYFGRIGYAGPRAADMATLRAIQALHPAVIAFENLDPLLGRPVRLDLASLQDKLIHARRGGYCFEQNTLLAAVLEALGFKVTPLAARVRWMVPPERAEGPRTHMLLRVDLADGPWLADVGFGGFLLAAPVRLEPGIEQPTPGGVMRLLAADGRFTLQTALPNGWHDLYRFTLEPQVPADYVVANWFTSTHPTALFTGNLLVQRLTPDGRDSLFNARLTRRPTDGTVSERVLAGPEELANVLETVFAITPPAAPAEIWARLPHG
jgi:N-hydroxyarylamine O-acetyltransferase